MQKVALVLSMSLPAILAQLTSIAMQYIDAGMVGSLGAAATGAIGLVSSTTWLMNGMWWHVIRFFRTGSHCGAGRKSEAQMCAPGIKILFAAVSCDVFLHQHRRGLPVFRELMSNPGGCSRYFSFIMCLLCKIRKAVRAMMHAAEI